MLTRLRPWNKLQVRICEQAYKGLKKIILQVCGIKGDKTLIEAKPWNFLNNQIINKMPKQNHNIIIHFFSLCKQNINPYQLKWNKENKQKIIQNSQKENKYSIQWEDYQSKTKKPLE